ncbi:hypothetical protein GBZ26_18705 [Azospirillum formosense]|uniref:Helix-turn-helix domain-containing protein n=1 Tax=Azospirillum formosense TaxID=861533 RepID=A0ABX2KXA9_9PROT|nr:hypothetical protein [Azospirillum formosense]MBY3757718.1 hypothetical protein [Azospirillum formosense]NUB21216.1 hypothetical protein [Azospirillum formosense]
MATTISQLTSLTDCDDLTADHLEETRQALGLTTAEIAEAVGWSVRKYQRTLDAAREAGAVDRDTVLMLRGLESVLASQTPHSSSLMARRSMRTVDRSGGVPERFRRVFANSNGKPDDRDLPWTLVVAPDILRVLVERANARTRITYGEIAELLLDRGLLKQRVWPYTAYGRPLGLICGVLLDLGLDEGRKVPVLSTIVVNRTGEPGPGFDDMAKRYYKAWGGDARRVNRDRSGAIQELQEEVFAFDDWDGVRQRLGLAPL